MIGATLSAQLEPVIPLTVHGPNGASESISAVVDTGFNGILTLPLSVVEGLGLVRQSRAILRLADGVPRDYVGYVAEIEWAGIRRTIIVSAIGDVALIGMQLLFGFRLQIDVEIGGAVEITAL